jgi:hypothetical protein
MPSAGSFPSGQSASAAFAVTVGDVLPALRLPLRIAASALAGRLALCQWQLYDKEQTS